MAWTPALAQQADVQTCWRLLDYLAVDYSGAVSDRGQIVSAPEYAEMKEFSATAAKTIAALPDKPQKAALNSDADRLQAAIDRKAPPAEVAGIARSLGQALLAAYPVPLAPARAPDLKRGGELFRENCSSCHGLTGAADTPQAKQLDPPPVAFSDKARADQRSPFALYQVISQGLEGTAMASFDSLSPDDRWALAYYASRFAYPDKLIEQGKAVWESDANLRQRVPDLKTLSGLTEAALARDIGAERATAVLAYLRSQPQAVISSNSTLALAKQRLQESLIAYQAGDRARAKSLALSAYLDGFEPVEAALSVRNGALMADVERGMGELRAAIDRGESADAVAERVSALDAKFGEVETALSPDRGSAASTFVGAATILLREGLEALLIVIAMLAFLRKGDRAEMTRPVHYGWVGALAAGVLTWWAATELITVSGATRELTEGLGSVLAAVVLLFVGIWMHGKAQANEWQRYIREKLSGAVTSGSAWFLFLLSFIAVYREIFETILFYVALAAEGNIGALVGGALFGAAVLAAIAVAMLRFSQRLPIAKFFAFSSALVAVLAVVLAGKGIAALQEAGLIGVSPLNEVPRITMLGLFPTVQVVAAQLITLLILLAGFAWNRRRAATTAAA
ncbi:cytochrome c/FTR1 family iron permease [Sphingomonas sp.]|uniref:cytochrome c/FTR1 family iron permease n=1 Tax=Sphingomonas sp. TaxID=28214 RepID=UPI0025D5C61D|nr:cytochrome c/FTR1 family iron permease [Sphingomonas sp.]